jgi:hypothetical protein
MTEVQGAVLVEKDSNVEGAEDLAKLAQGGGEARIQKVSLEGFAPVSRGSWAWDDKGPPGPTGRGCNRALLVGRVETSHSMSQS